MGIEPQLSTRCRIESEDLLLLLADPKCARSRFFCLLPFSSIFFFAPPPVAAVSSRPTGVRAQIFLFDVAINTATASAPLAAAAAAAAAATADPPALVFVPALLCAFSCTWYLFWSMLRAFVPLLRAMYIISSTS